MIYCDNRNCEQADSALERISDYRVIDGAVICAGCDEAEREEIEWRDAKTAISTMKAKWAAFQRRSYDV